MSQNGQSHVLDLQRARAQIQKLLPKDTDLATRAEEILVKIISKNARVYETDRASIGLPAVAAYLACEEVGSRKITQRVCQTESRLGPKLFKRALELCRAAKNLDESKINFTYLAQRFNGSKALHFMPKTYALFKESCFEARIVDQATWDANHILVICAIFCWCCDRVALWEGERPYYNGQEVTFACGLSWENVQKSMYYNLNPHCSERMQNWLKEHDELQDRGGSPNGGMPPPSGSQHPSKADHVLPPGHPPPPLEDSRKQRTPVLRTYPSFMSSKSCY
ncbi:uncharacterized protein EI90DRAFT_1347429 [Cantharellus anzutake]|uniref:uncharacterized protein n=1 Tax=Cantharellus anzutake TaxID=1750568 RepID=UPI001906477B|nr:uncharacterized protein EI90DRAFT_1347429 [Cantharellus anzutake]KAF8329809.1 hypothetical protein EI90DRAFT_1347429 [Cantharellus anzutake]